MWHVLGFEAVSNCRHVVNASCLFIDTCVKFSNDRMSRWTAAKPIEVHWTWTAVLIHRKGLRLQEWNAYTTILFLVWLIVKWFPINMFSISKRKVHICRWLIFHIQYKLLLTDWLTVLFQAGLLHPRHHGNHGRGHCCIYMQEQRHLWQVGLCVVTHGDKKHVCICFVSLLPTISALSFTRDAVESGMVEGGTFH